jgi:hypothetical protein
MERKRSSKRKHPKPKAVLRLPDLDQAKSAVLNRSTSADAQRGYRHASPGARSEPIYQLSNASPSTCKYLQDDLFFHLEY